MLCSLQEAHVRNGFQFFSESLYEGDIYSYHILRMPLGKSAFLRAGLQTIWLMGPTGLTFKRETILCNVLVFKADENIIYVPGFNFHPFD